MRASVLIEGWKRLDGLRRRYRILLDRWTTDYTLLTRDRPSWLAVLNTTERLRRLTEYICSVVEIGLWGIKMVHERLRRFELLGLHGLLLHIECHWLDRCSFREGRFLEFRLLLLILLELAPDTLRLLLCNRFKVDLRNLCWFSFWDRRLHLRHWGW